MKQAILEAQKALEKEEVPIGACIVLNNRIIAKGHNTIETLHDATAHAEMIAITSASEYLKTWRLEKCSIFVTIEPCLMCLGAILNSRVQTLVYGADEPKYGAFTHFGIKPTNLKIIKGVLQQETVQLIKCFFSSLRKKKNH